MSYTCTCCLGQSAVEGVALRGRTHSVACYTPASQRYVSIMHVRPRFLLLSYIGEVGACPHS